MARKRSSRDSISTDTAVALVAEAALNFLKETKGVVSWTISDVVKSLNISRAEAENVVALLEAQGYAQRSGTDWITTSAGENRVGRKAAPIHL